MAEQLPVQDYVAEIIKEDLWPNPVQYFLAAQNDKPREADAENEKNDDNEEKSDHEHDDQQHVQSDNGSNDDHGEENEGAWTFTFLAH